MPEGLGISVNPEVFKIIDPRVEKLRTGRMSAELFSRMIGPGDPFMLVDGCVYAMSEREFYASRAVMPVNEMSERVFREVLALEDLSFMHRMDSEYVEKVRLDIDKCAACTYRKYKDEITRLVKKYNIPVSEPEFQVVEDNAVYPKTTSEVAPLVSLMLQHMFHTDMPRRRSCIDCVEKHISQAYVLAGECVCGYPEHLAFVVAHLGEAIDEMPEEATLLRASVMFCLAKTKKDGKPFVPAYALLPLINLARSEMDQAIEDRSDDIVDDRSDSMDIDFTQGMRDEISMLPACLLERLKSLVVSCRELGKGDDRLAWEGSMAAISECVGNLAPKLAGMFRNRRLLFIGDISLTSTEEWGGYDVVAYIDSCLDPTRQD